MKLRELIEQVGRIRPHAYEEDILTLWVNEVEGEIQTDVLLWNVHSLIAYDWEKDADAELLVHPPHDKIYRDYLMAKIDEANGEYDRAQNSYALFNQHMNEYKAWYALNYKPAGVGGFH